MVRPFNSQRLGQTANPFHDAPQAETPEQVAARKRQELQRQATGVQGIASNQALSQVVSPAQRVQAAVSSTGAPVKPGVGPAPVRGVTGTSTPVPGAFQGATPFTAPTVVPPITPPPSAGGFMDRVRARVRGEQEANAARNVAPPTTPPALPPEAAPLPTYNTNGYAQPGHVVSGSAQAPAGWDTAKWADANHQSPKYAVGRILSQFPSTPEGLQAALGEVQKAYPGTTLVGNDKIQIPGVGTIDVGVGFAQGGGPANWGWNDLAEAQSAGAQAFPGNASAAAFSNVLTPLGGLQTNQADVQSVIANILAQLGAGVGGSGGG